MPPADSCKSSRFSKEKPKPRVQEKGIFLLIQSLNTLAKSTVKNVKLIKNIFIKILLLIYLYSRCNEKEN